MSSTMEESRPKFWDKMDEWMGSSELLTAMKSTLKVILVSMENWRIVSSTPVAEKSFGYGPRELEGEHINRLIPSDHHNHHDQYIEEYRKNPTTRLMGDRKLAGVRKDGSVFTMSIWLLPCVDTDSVLVVVFE